MINQIVVGLFFILYVANAIYVDGWDAVLSALSN